MIPPFLRLAAATLGLCLAAAAPARDAFVLISGGGTPLSNNYSQYLQARAMAGHLQQSYPPDCVWVFFGFGNREGGPAGLADVHREVKEDGHLRDTWVPGVLRNNRPARKEEILRALRDEILPLVHDGGTLYLFIGDHGELAKEAPRESVVTLWQLERRGAGWNTNPAEVLSVTELRGALEAGIGEGRVVFCMTQCHSGGFHFLGAPRRVWPESGWFVHPVPAWEESLSSQEPLAAAGFTAVDEESLAAGCSPDPDPDNWAGYERFVPEALLGVDLMSGRAKGRPLASYAAAHDAAVVVDQTIDKPRSTSEQYLDAWAGVIEKLAAEPALAPPAAAQVKAYQAAVDRGLMEAAGGGFAAKRAQFASFIARMGEQAPKAARLLRSGSRAELERAMGPAEARAARPRDRGKGPTARDRLWREAVRPAWKAAVEDGRVGNLSGDALAFEKYLLGQEEKGRDLLFPQGGRNPLLNDLYWHSGYALPATLDAKKAEAVTRWGAVRRERIADWARGAADPAVRRAAESLFSGRRAGMSGGGAARTLSTPIAAERALFYRRVIAAWGFLIAMDDGPALARLRELIDLETTPLPAPGRAG